MKAYTLSLLLFISTVIAAQPISSFDGKWIAKYTERDGTSASATLDLRDGRGSWSKEYPPRTRHRCLAGAQATLEVRKGVYYLIIQPSLGPPCSEESIALTLTPVGQGSFVGRWPTGEEVLFDSD